MEIKTCGFLICFRGRPPRFGTGGGGCIGAPGERTKQDRGAWPCDRARRFYPHHKRRHTRPEAMVQYVNPGGWSLAWVAAKIASDGTISVDYKVTDPNGLALDTARDSDPRHHLTQLAGAYIPKGQASTCPIFHVALGTAVTGRRHRHPGPRRTRAEHPRPSRSANTSIPFNTSRRPYFDPTATHRIGIYGSRNLGMDLGTNDASTTFDFVPAGASRRRATPFPRRTATRATTNWHSTCGSRAGLWISASCAIRTDQRSQHGQLP